MTNLPLDKCVWILQALVSRGLSMEEAKHMLYNGRWKYLLWDIKDDILGVGDRAGQTCCNCGIDIEGDSGGQHMAGHYCDTCWEVYKGHNRRKCLLCGKPEYECYC